ncbi:MAG: TatD family nuclease-associated radical SAM protein [Gammaproteobacteria bacterium]|nr:TatD family nuclease-associated radical SAM protein [Gammaproteobacteria bacterium]
MNQTIAYRINNNLYLNITDRCTLECKFCPKTQGIKKVHDFDLTLEQRPEIESIIESIGNPKNYDSIVFCGFGEPTLRLKELLTVAEHIKKEGGKVRINTDGLANLFHKRNVLPEFKGLVDALSVSLNGQNETVYNQHCKPALKGSFNAVLDFLRLAPKYVPEVTVTAIHGLEGLDIDACENLAKQLGVGFRQRTLDIVG